MRRSQGPRRAQALAFTLDTDVAAKALAAIPTAPARVPLDQRANPPTG